MADKVKILVDTLKDEAKAIETINSPTALFMMSQAALESGWLLHAIGKNIFGIKANSNWLGKKQLVTTTEFLKTDNIKFPEIISISKLPSGKFKYVVKDWFRDYDSYKECLQDHFKLLTNTRYSPALKYRNDLYKYAYEITKLGYSTSKPDDYAKLIVAISKMIQKHL